MVRSEFLEVWQGKKRAKIFYYRRKEPLTTRAVLHYHGIPTEM